MQLNTLLYFIIVIAFVSGQDRQITTILNPDCTDCSVNTTLIYIKAVGSHDTIHQIWDFTRGMPTVILAICSHNSTVEIAWRNDVPIGFKLSEVPLYSFGAAIDSLYEYDDLSDIGRIDEKSPKSQLSLRHASWSRLESVMNDTREAMVRMKGYYHDHHRSGVVDMKLDLLSFQDYAVDLPHLIHTANSSLIDISLVNFTSAQEYNASRYAIHFVLVSTDGRDQNMSCVIRKSLDDEHTPGVFEIIEVKTPRAEQSGDGGFIQFRPVGYTEPERSVSSSNNAYLTSLNRTSLPNKSTLKLFYYYFKVEPLVEQMFISFGLPGDGYYRQHNYTSWSFTIGYGSPPIESFSLFVIIIICVGLGVPMLLAVSGITYALHRRHRQRNAPTRFTDDE